MADNSQTICMQYDAQRPDSLYIHWTKARLSIIVMDDDQTFQMDENQTVLIVMCILTINYLEQCIEFAHQNEYLEDIFHKSMFCAHCSNRFKSSQKHDENDHMLC